MRGRGGGNAKRKACVERENFMKSILKRIVQSTFLVHSRRERGRESEKVAREVVTSCLTRSNPPLPLPSRQHMAWREHYYGHRRGVNAANGHNDKRNGHLETDTGEAGKGWAGRGGGEQGAGPSPALNY